MNSNRMEQKAEVFFCFLFFLLLSEVVGKKILMRSKVNGASLTSGLIADGTSELARCQNDRGGITSSEATRGHVFSYELSHCVIPKELSTAAASPVFPGCGIWTGPR